MPRRRRRRGTAVAIAVGVAAAAAGIALWQLSGSRPSAAAESDALAAALTDGGVADIRFANATSADAAAAWQSIRAGMRGAAASVRATGTTVHGKEARTTLRWLWRLPLGRRWAYTTSVRLRYSGGSWKPVWSRRLANPGLRAGDVLQLSVQQPPRAPILAADGQAIVRPRPVVDVGIEPKRVKNLRFLLRRLHAVLGIRTAPLARAVRSAAPTAFVPVITLRRPRYEQVRAAIHPLPGTVFRVGTLPLAPTRAFARSLLGVTGEATAEIVASSHGRIAPGELVGLSGLQRTFDSRLAGVAGLQVRAVPTGGRRAARTLYATAVGPPGRALRTTLEIRAQEAADVALAGVRKPSALVAIRISSGNVIAVSVGPDPGAYDIALLGRYPPGSTFKVVTTLALLERGLQPGDTVDCPALLTVNGKQFHNAEHEILGGVSFAQDFAHSCNTAFAGLASRVGGRALPTAARSLGIGRRLSLGPGIAAFGGSVPVPGDPVELAAEAFGQGRILVSPLAVAAAAAAVARGRWLPPRLILDPPPPSPPPTPPPLPAGPLATLRSLMREVVTSGTGTALAAQPGLPVYGKTGTAEVGAQNPPRTDAWFIGYQGDVAFAALVADTNNGYGGTLAAPIVARFLGALTRR